MGKVILERKFEQQVTVLDILDNEIPTRYRVQFELSPSCFIECWLDFGTDDVLRIYDIKGRQRPEALLQFSAFISREQWLRELIETGTRF